MLQGKSEAKNLEPQRLWIAIHKAIQHVTVQIAVRPFTFVHWLLNGPCKRCEFVFKGQPTRMSVEIPIGPGHSDPQGCCRTRAVIRQTPRHPTTD